jgi:hypothetical protein
MSDETGENDMPDDDVGARWLIVGFVVCLFLGLGVLGWHYRSTDSTAPMCASAEAPCGDKSDASAQ